MACWVHVMIQLGLSLVMFMSHAHVSPFTIRSDGSRMLHRSVHDKRLVRPGPPSCHTPQGMIISRTCCISGSYPRDCHMLHFKPRLIRANMPTAEALGQVVTHRVMACYASVHACISRVVSCSDSPRPVAADSASSTHSRVLSISHRYIVTSIH